MEKHLLTSEQTNILANCLAGADLAADIAQAHVYIYVRDMDSKYINVKGQALPLKAFVDHSAGMAGRRLRLAEEPLVGRTLQSGMPVTGRRESALGRFAKIKLFPLLDAKRRCYAVIAFEKYGPENLDGEDLFIDTAMTLMLNYEQRFSSDANYKRLTPSDGVMLIDPRRAIIGANNNARHILSLIGIPNPIGLRVNSGRLNWPLVGMVLKAGQAESKELRKQGLLLSLRVLPSSPRPDAGSAILILTDITELKKKEEELLVKAAVIKEIHHRVKNNLQMISSLLRLQKRRTKEEKVKDVLDDVIGRINSIALVHEALSQQENDRVNVAEVAGRIYRSVLKAMVPPDFALEASLDAEDIYLSSEQVVAIGLILNELLQNALTHAFARRNKGCLQVRLAKEGEELLLEVSDDGRGLPENFGGAKEAGLGLKLIQTLTEADLHGTFKLLPLAMGTLARVRIPLERKR